MADCCPDRRAYLTDGTSEMLDVEPLVGLSLFKTLLARLMNFESLWNLSSPGPPDAEELIVMLILQSDGWVICKTRSQHVAEELTTQT